MYSKEVLKIVRRLQDARQSLIRRQPFYAVLLLHMQFSLDPMCESVCTDGERIVFCPDFLEGLSDRELEFVLMHEVLHAALDHCGRRQEKYEYDDYNTACDIVVNSNILYSCGMDPASITLNGQVCMHLTPDEREGFECSVEEVYDLLSAMPKSAKGEKKDRDASGKGDAKGGDASGTEEVSARTDGGFDDHTYWGQNRKQEDGSGDKDPENMQKGTWGMRILEAAQIAEHLCSSREMQPGTVPLAAERIIHAMTDPQTDWRTVLNDFVQEEVTDYSFDPPDRRFQDSPFLLPDYNEKDECVKDLLFMIDTSGSMSDQMIREVFSEVYGAIQQFGGRLQGWLGFFDASVVDPVEFSSEEDFRIIRPYGGGGTNFECIFEYVNKNREKLDPASIIILTDGFADWPEETAAHGTPVLWVINNEDATPPWGKVTRIVSSDGSY